MQECSFFKWPVYHLWNNVLPLGLRIDYWQLTYGGKNGLFLKKWPVYRLWNNALPLGLRNDNWLTLRPAEPGLCLGVAWPLDTRLLPLLPFWLVLLLLLLASSAPFLGTARSAKTLLLTAFLLGRGLAAWRGREKLLTIGIRQVCTYIFFLTHSFLTAKQLFPGFLTFFYAIFKF